MAAFTVPLTLTSCVVAPLLALVMLPLMLPALADALMRASMVVRARVPPLGVSVSDVCQVLPLSFDNCTPVGAATTTLAVRLLPLTVKDFGVEAVPAVVVPRLSLYGLTVSAGAAFTVSLSVAVVLLPVLLAAVTVAVLDNVPVAEALTAAVTV
jgi:hypothetical protein